MNLRRLQIFSSLISFTLCIENIQAATLNDAYTAALKKNEMTVISEKEVSRNEEKVSQAWGSIYPHLSLNGNYLRQDAGPNANSPFVKPNQGAAKLTLVQPLFHGLSDFYYLKSNKANYRASKAQYQQEANTLYTQVAAVFYQILSLEKDLENLKATLELTRDRSKDLLARVKIGRSRRSEWLTNEAQLANLSSQIENTNSQISQARNQFEVMTQLASTTRLEDTDESYPKSTMTLEGLLNLVEKRPDIDAQKEALEAAENNVSVVQGQHFPAIDAAGNYYFYRTGILQDSKWDVGLTATIPLFQGGTTQSQVREAIIVRQEKELMLAKTRKEALKEIRNTFTAYQSAISQFEMLNQALKVSEESYKLTNKEFKTGLVTNLDVIQSLNTLNENKRQRDRTYFSIKSSYAALMASVGQVSEANK